MEVSDSHCLHSASKRVSWLVSHEGNRCKLLWSCCQVGKKQFFKLHKWYRLAAEIIEIKPMGCFIFACGSDPVIQHYLCVVEAALSSLSATLAHSCTMRRKYDKQDLHLCAQTLYYSFTLPECNFVNCDIENKQTSKQTNKQTNKQLWTFVGRTHTRWLSCLKQMVRLCTFSLLTNWVNLVLWVETNTASILFIRLFGQHGTNPIHSAYSQ